MNRQQYCATCAHYEEVGIMHGITVWKCLCDRHGKVTEKMSGFRCDGWTSPVALADAQERTSEVLS